MADDVRSHPIEVNRTNAGVKQGSTDLTGPTHKTDQGRAGLMEQETT